MITDEDRDNIRAFLLKLSCNMPHRIFNRMREAFTHKLDITSEWIIIHCLSVLSGITPTNFDCCINSCIAYTSKYKYFTRCPFCKEHQYGKGRKAWRVFSYIPLIPQLQSFFQNSDMVARLGYRNQFSHTDGLVRDAFDGRWYQKLCKTHVVIDGVHQPHKFFSGENNIALSLATDGFLLFSRRRSGPSATPILLLNLNLPPTLHTHLENLICVGVIPGPHQPKDLGSYLAPLDNECARLAEGVRTFDALASTSFYLHAYILFKSGDIITIEKLLNMKGHNAFSPCRSCEIKGVRKEGKGGTVYYTPLTTPHDVHHQSRASLDAHNLPPRSHAGILSAPKEMDEAPTKRARAEIARRHGLRGEPTLMRVNSLDYS